MLCAIAPVLKARAIAAAIVVMLSFFMIVPLFAESVGGAMAEPPAIVPVFTLHHLTRAISFWRFCQSVSCFSATSLEMPYASWILPASLSRLPAITSSWSSVSLPHCCLTLPLNCFQFPSIWSQFISISFRVTEDRYSASTAFAPYLPFVSLGGMHTVVCTLAYIVDAQAVHQWLERLDAVAGYFDDGNPRLVSNAYASATRW